MKKHMKSIIIDTGRKHYGGFGDNREKLEYESYFYGEDFEFEIVVPIKKRRVEAKQFSAYIGDWDFSDRLQPLWRWLDKQHGRKWNEVYSELRSANDYRNVRGRHLLDHALTVIEGIGQHSYWVRDKSFYRHVNDEGIFIVPWHGQSPRSY